MMIYQKIYLFCGFVVIGNVLAVFEFPEHAKSIPSADLQALTTIERTYLQAAIEMGVKSIEHHENLEGILINSNIVVTNGSTTHAQYLETFPNEEARAEDKVARKILKSSLYILNAKCLPLNIKSQSCVEYFSEVSLPDSDLRQDCLRINTNTKDGHRSFRRLLPANYEDGFDQMLTHLPRPREITNLGLFGQLNAVHNGNYEKDDQKNLILVQWAQFIEHDLSKSVVTSMKNGVPIDCCDSDFYQLSPRNIHPACAPLDGLAPDYKFGPVSCLSYVRSALAVDPNCKFGAAAQLNQATGALDLSQLYGFTKESENTMRLFQHGKLKFSGDVNPKMSFLPLAQNRNDYCVDNTNRNCYMAGDSRVNSNPFMTLIYTIFLRNHNEYAKQLRNSNGRLTDEQIYQKAKKMNIDIYRGIVFNEWLPIILGADNAAQINSEPMRKVQDFSKLGTSNEFGVAAIRFYLSMLPNALINTNPTHFYSSSNHDNLIVANVPKKIFTMSDEFYKSDFLTAPVKLDLAVNAMLNQRAMKMDSNYAECLTKKFLSTSTSATKINGSDALAWDIQRGRDHGLQGYIKYLEICAQKPINSWQDLEQFIKHEGIEKLKSVYKSFEDIDLIVGGISEIPMSGSTVGPTFNCILGEQFSNIRKWQFTMENPDDDNAQMMKRNSQETAAKLLCETTSLISVPKNIFLAPSESNPLVYCATL